ncbi:hypothetical protein HPB47_016862 [Ixodes persulcatus]|uniref:Uncharacterized protein n=1 Tax=Ixodes persulcatus TaxID=34615 RepID=A0AC60QQ08_IXOPE|nr:hypothetical protein HPB47_016862 [Ixodes persulcatus]
MAPTHLLHLPLQRSPLSALSSRCSSATPPLSTLTSHHLHAPTDRSAELTSGAADSHHITFCTSLDAYTSDVSGRAEDARRIAHFQTLRSQHHHQLRHAQSHPTVSYNIGDDILLATPLRQLGRSAKLMRKFVGPYRVLRRLSATNYEVVPVHGHCPCRPYEALPSPNLNPTTNTNVPDDRHSSPPGVLHAPGRPREIWTALDRRNSSL